MPGLRWGAFLFLLLQPHLRACVLQPWGTSSSAPSSVANNCLPPGEGLEFLCPLRCKLHSAWVSGRPWAPVFCPACGAACSLPGAGYPRSRPFTLSQCRLRARVQAWEGLRPLWAAVWPWRSSPAAPRSACGTLQRVPLPLRLRQACSLEIMPCQGPSLSTWGGGVSR